MTPVGVDYYIIIMSTPVLIGSDKMDLCESRTFILSDICMYDQGYSLYIYTDFEKKNGLSLFIEELNSHY